MFLQYDQYLSRHHSCDYWSDEAIIIATSLLSRFSKEDWAELLEKWNGKSPEWKVRLAETIDPTIVFQQTDIVQSILFEMLGDDHIDVVIAAADTLRSDLSSSLEAVPDGDLDRISRVRDQGGPVARIVLTEFLQKAAEAHVRNKK
jgi:hypothetical protein